MTFPEPAEVYRSRGLEAQWAVDIGDRRQHKKDEALLHVICLRYSFRRFRVARQLEADRSSAVQSRTRRENRSHVVILWSKGRDSSLVPQETPTKE